MTRGRGRGRALALAALLLGPAGCVSTTPPPRPVTTDLAGVRRLALVVPAPGEFSVFQARAKGAPAEGAGATIAAGAVFGVVGALVAAGTVSAVVRDADEARTVQVRPHVAEFPARARFVDAVVRTLRAGGRFAEVEALEAAPGGADAARYDAVATARIGDWGLHLVPTREGDALAGFAEMTMQLVVGPGARLVWDERRIVAGPGRRPLADYAGDGELLRRELTATLEASGERMAAELLYPREEKR